MASLLLKYRQLAFGVAVAITIAVVVLSLASLPSTGPNFWDVLGGDKAKHFIAYGTLGVVWSWALLPGRRWWLLWLALAALGVSLEYAQWAFNPNRYFEVADMLANAAGALVGCFGFKRIFPH